MTNWSHNFNPPPPPSPAARSDADEVLTAAPRDRGERSRLRGEITHFCETAPIGEVALLHELMRRLLRGRAQYGAWVAANESRDLEREQYEELLDGMVYGAMMRVVEETPRPATPPLDKDLAYFLQDIAENYDHDESAHRYSTRCRQCEAEKLRARLCPPVTP